MAARKQPAEEVDECKMQSDEEPDGSPDVDGSTGTDMTNVPPAPATSPRRLEPPSAQMDSDASDDKLPFMCGVCEGFYGTPWTTIQRGQLFKRMQTMQMNTYLYAPKDDYKHRIHWRHLYNEAEASELKALVRSAVQCGVNFVYALSPGLDITYSQAEDMDLLQKKLEQVRDFGATSFALLFDDIDSEMCAEDKDTFSSMADAQTSTANRVYDCLRNPQVFLFCPTEYCSARASPTVQKSPYLQTLGSKLNPGIDILWTGTKVVSRLIGAESIAEVARVLQRAPVIWDNLHANDYDLARVYLGPYSGRSPRLLDTDADGWRRLRGVLTNPNCEFEANFVAMHTLAQWSKATVCRFPSVSVKRDVAATSAAEDMETDPPPPATAAAAAAGEYHPKRALVCAIDDWLCEFYESALSGASEASAAAPLCPPSEPVGKSAGAPSPPADKTGDARMTDDTDTDDDGGNDDDDDDDEMTNSVSESIAKALPPSDAAAPAPAAAAPPGGGRRRYESAARLTNNDVLTLCDLFYLPFEHGPRAVRLLRRLHWLLANVESVSDAAHGADASGGAAADGADSADGGSLEVREWYARAIEFHELHRDVATVIDKFMNMPNRRVLYDLYGYVSAIRSVLALANSYVRWQGMGQPDKEPFRGGEQEPWTHTGGLQAELRRMLPIDGEVDTCPALKPSARFASRVFTVRPYSPDDKDDIYLICRQTCDDGADGSDMFETHPDLVADQSIGGLLQLFPHFCYVLEDDASVCGYALAAPSHDVYRRRLLDEWLPLMREKYPRPTGDPEKWSTAEELLASIHATHVSPPGGLLADYPAFVHVNTMSRRAAPAPAPACLLACLQRAMRVQGARGMHALVPATHTQCAASHLRLGFEDISGRVKPPDGMLLLAQTI